MILNDNRRKICNALDEKIERVINGEENQEIKKIRTYK